jgi:hypothetical protein
MVVIADRELIWGIQEELEPVGSKRRTARERYMNRKSRVPEYSDQDLTDSAE